MNPAKMEIVEVHDTYVMVRLTTPGGKSILTRLPRTADIDAFLAARQA